MPFRFKNKPGIATPGALASKEQIEAESNAFYATARVWDDGVIDPRDTRTVLGIALSAAFSNVVRGTDRFGVFRP